MLPSLQQEAAAGKPVTGSYTRVNDAGSLAASNLSATAPYRCFV